MVALPLPATQDATSIRDRQAHSAARLGVDTVGQYRLNLHKMRKEGVLVSLTLHGFTMFTRRAGWLELGIPSDDVRAQQFTRGFKHLVPRRYIRKLDTLDTRLRTCLQKFSLDIAGLRPYRYITYAAYAEWKETAADLEAELDALKEEIAEGYPDFKAAALDTHAETAREAWDAIIARKGGDPDHADHKLDGGDIIESREAFVEYVVARLLKEFPSPERIRTGIRVALRYNLMLSQADLAEDEYLAEYWRNLEAEQRAKTAYFDEYAAGQRRLAREEEMADQRAVEEREYTQRRLIRAEAEDRELEVRERRVCHEAIKEEIQREIRQQLAETVDPVTEIILKNRAALHEGLGEALASIEKNGYLHGKTAKKIGNLAAAWRWFQTFDESLIPEIDTLEAALERRIPHPNKKGATAYGVEAVQAQVRALILHTADAARTLSADLGATRAGALML